MSTILKNLKVGRPVLQSRLTDKNRLILLVDSQNACAVRVIDTETQKPLDGFKIDLPPKFPFGFQLSDDAVFVYNYAERTIDNYLIENHLKTGSNDLSLHHTNVTAFALAHNGYYYAVGDDQGNCTVWNPKISRPKAVLTNLGGRVESLSFEGSNNYLAIGTSDGHITIVEVGDSSNCAVLEGHHAPVSKMLFSGDFFLTGDRDGHLIVWHTEDLALLKDYALDSGEIVDIQGCFEGRGALLASRQGHLLLADLIELRHEPLLLDVLGEPLAGMTFDDATKKMVLSTTAGSLLFYDVKNDKEIEHFFAPKPKTDRKSVV